MRNTTVSRLNSSVQADDRRLVLAALPVIVLVALFLGRILSTSVLSYHESSLSYLLLARKEARPQNNKIYPVIIEQQIHNRNKTDQFRALSDVSSEGVGGITTRYGFHTLTRMDQLSLQSGGGVGGSSGTQNPRRIGDRKSSDEPSRFAGNGANGQGKAGGMHYKIPSNYRFKQHMALRYDGRSLLSIATEGLPGAAYFRHMLRQIEDSFAPPGLNTIYRDQFGYSMNQTIQAQVVKVQFALSREGQVTDVRVISSIGQYKVDRSCLDALRDQNFGPPPLEVLSRGNIFGINFIFPDLRRYQ